MNRRPYGYLVRALNELALLTGRCGFKKDVHDAGKSSSPNQRPDEEIPLPALGPNSASRDPEPSVLSGLRKISMTIRNRGNNAEADVLPTVALSLNEFSNPTSWLGATSVAKESWAKQEIFGSQ